MISRDMPVTLLDHMGSDLTVVNAARVSFAKESTMDGNELADKDVKLINYLAKHQHWSPFAHTFLQYRIKAPIFVARQLVKHQVGLSWNEVSRRYVDDDPEFYLPKDWRGRAENVKQGSSDNPVSDSKIITNWVISAYQEADFQYREMLKCGVAPELARMVLPQATYTEWYWSGSLYAFARVCKQRLDAHAQKETREVAEQIAAHAERIFPVSWNALLSQ